MCLFIVALYFVLLTFPGFSFVTSFPSVLSYCWLGLLTRKTVYKITYTVLVETLNTTQSMNGVRRWIKSFSLCDECNKCTRAYPLHTWWHHNVWVSRPQSTLRTLVVASRHPVFSTSWCCLLVTLRYHMSVYGCQAFSSALWTMKLCAEQSWIP